jgi:hypothetical protein
MTRALIGVLTRLLWHNVQHFRPHVHVHVVIDARQVKMKAWQQVEALSKCSNDNVNNRRVSNELLKAHCQNKGLTTGGNCQDEGLTTDGRTVKISPDR